MRRSRKASIQLEPLASSYVYTDHINLGKHGTRDLGSFPHIALAILMTHRPMDLISGHLLNRVSYGYASGKCSVTVLLSVKLVELSSNLSITIWY